MDLFSSTPGAPAPLAFRMRPRTLDEFVGQEHIVGKGRLLRRVIQADQVSSLIFYGPPGTGKTTLAQVIANSTKSHFITMNAVLAGVKELRESIEVAKEEPGPLRPAHHAVRRRGAPLEQGPAGRAAAVGGERHGHPGRRDHREPLLRGQPRPRQPQQDLPAQAAHGGGPARGRARRRQRSPSAGTARGRSRSPRRPLDHLVKISNGDARSLLNALELAVETTPAHFPPPAGEEIVITREIAEESIQRKVVLYDKEGDYHFDTISAYIKSVRGSDPDAALYWLARMVLAGEDPHYIFRRMLILASEDVGMADPQALAVRRVGRGRLRPGGHAGGTVSPGPRDALPGHGAEVQLVDGILRRARAAGIRTARRARRPITCGTPAGTRKASATGRATCTPTPSRITGWPSSTSRQPPGQGVLLAVRRGTGGGDPRRSPAPPGDPDRHGPGAAQRRGADILLRGDIQRALDRAAFRRPADRAHRDPGPDLRAPRRSSGTAASWTRMRARGLLLWEALRRAPEGGVWGIVATDGGSGTARAPHEGAGAGGAPGDPSDRAGPSWSWHAPRLLRPEQSGVPRPGARPSVSISSSGRDLFTRAAGRRSPAPAALPAVAAGTGRGAFDRPGHPAPRTAALCRSSQLEAAAAAEARRRPKSAPTRIRRMTW